MPETILIVDDEDPIRRTFREWLTQAGLDVTVLVAADAEFALLAANEQPIDLAILDWNLGAGNDGLSLLEDLAEFNPDTVAILVTGYANRATPLEALRKGVRDYLDKNQDLTRETFLAAVRRQLDKITPAKRQRELNRTLSEFRDAVRKVLPLVQTAAALADPVPLPNAVASLFEFLIRTTGAVDGALIVRHVSPTGEAYRAYAPHGQPLDTPLVPFARSLAAGVVGMQEPAIMNAADLDTLGPVDRQPFEEGRESLLAAPLAVGPGTHAVLELFDKPGGFGPSDRRLAAAAADFGAELLRHALSQRQTQQMLFDAVSAALSATESVERALAGPTPTTNAPSDVVLEQLRRGMDAAVGEVLDGGEAVKLAEAVRALAARHGPAAVRHCTQLVASVRELLDETVGTGG